MRKIIMPVLTSILFFSFLVVAGYADIVKADSKIAQVTVYSNSALVTRTAEVEISPGEHSVLFENIVPEIDENSLTVSGRGTAQVKIFGAQIKREYLKQSPDDRAKSLENKIESLDNQVNSQNAALGVIDEEKEFLKSVKLFSGQQLPKDLVTKMPATTDLENLSKFLSGQFQASEDRKAEINLKIRDLQKQKEVLLKELSELRGPMNQMKRSIVVDLEGLTAGKLTLSVSYLTGANQARWMPVYDARVDFEKSEVELASFGILAQTTGEDWVDAEISLSTARPSIAGKMPQLESWYLRPLEVFVQRKAERGFSMENSLKRGLGGRMEYKADDIGDQFSMSLSESKDKDAEMVYAESESRATAISYQIKKPVTVKSDGSERRVPILIQNLKGSFEYTSTPKLSPYAYLKVEVTNGKEDQLLPGRVNVFLDGGYVGTSNIDKPVGSEQKLDLYLGVDEGIAVKRELLKEKSDDTLIGNIPSPNKTVFYEYRITVENYKAKNISLDLFDHIPVAQDDKIHVKNIKYSIAPTEENVKGKSGVARWHFDLEPKAKKEITYSFIVERPRNLEISGL